MTLNNVYINIKIINKNMMDKNVKNAQNIIISKYVFKNFLITDLKFLNNIIYLIITFTKRIHTFVNISYSYILIFLILMILSEFFEL